MHDVLIFDLDGTLTNPAEGVVKSANAALVQCGFKAQPEHLIIKHIGPQIDHTFKILSGSEDEAVITKLITIYRQRYDELGYAENYLYNGIKTVLTKLHNIENIEGKKLSLGLCTSKRADFVEKILAMFELIHFFDFVSCGDVGIEKWQQLAQLREKKLITDNSVMIGDRYVDITAAKKNELKSAAVLWGFGSKEELDEHKPDYIFTAVSELLQLVPSVE